MIPTTDTLLKNDFPDGSDATLECGNGYVKESGSGIITCLNEKWTEPDLICKSELHLVCHKQSLLRQKQLSVSKMVDWVIASVKFY